VQYDLTDDFNVLNSVTKSAASNEYFHFVTCDGTKVYATWTNTVNFRIEEYSLTLGSAATRYDSVGVHLLGITFDSTYVYAIDQDNGLIIRMLKASPYTADSYNPGVTNMIDIAHYDGNLYYINKTTINVTATATFNSDSVKYTDANQDFNAINFNSAIPYLAQKSGRVVKFDGVTNFNVAGYIPTKISMSCPLQNIPITHASNSTFFYAFSLIDIYGQESHLHQGCVVTRVDGVQTSKITISVNVNSEAFAEMTSPSTDPDDALSVWNEFRRIKKIRVYRAYNETSTSQEPTTDFNFLREIDINDVDWTEVTANALYTFEFYDGTAQKSISTVTYEESSGLPETFKPYYTNWQYGIEFQDRYYYGNVLTDELNAHEIIETPINAPDVAYQHDQNIDYFHPNDGDEIKGFATAWNRFIAFKGHRCMVYYGLDKENNYDIGTSAPNSIVTHNNVVYFIYRNGIYALTPSGYNRISMPVDELLAAETLTSVSAVYYKNKRKLWFHVPSSKSYLFNHDEGTWDIYDVNNGAAFNFAYVGLALDNKIFGSNDVDEKVWEFDSSIDDASPDMTVIFKSADIPLGDSFLNAVITRLFVTFHNTSGTEDLTVTIYYLNEDGWHNKSYTFDSSPTADETKTKYLSGVWGQVVRFEISEAIADKLYIDSIGIEYLVKKHDRILNVST